MMITSDYSFFRIQPVRLISRIRTNNLERVKSKTHRDEEHQNKNNEKDSSSKGNHIDEYV